MHQKSLILLVLCSLAQFSSADCIDAWLPVHPPYTYTTVESISSVTNSSICPVIDPSKMPGGTLEEYLSSSSCLGYFGPLGPQGPLGILGPIGNNTWNPSQIISGFGDWSLFAKYITGFGGPLGMNGPLGKNGPVSPAQYYGIKDPGQTLFKTNDFAVQLRALGLWSALGPIGPLGALGALGPLGPIGAHGYKSDVDGNYVDFGKIVRTITTDFDINVQKTYELFESYTENTAKCIETPDASFMVNGGTSQFDELDLYPIFSKVDQFITVVIVPIMDADAFSLAIYDAEGKIIASSEASFYINTVQLMVPAGTTLYAGVQLTSSWQPFESTYRLFVTGSLNSINDYNIKGDHIHEWYKAETSVSSFPAKISTKNVCPTQTHTE